MGIWRRQKTFNPDNNCSSQPAFPNGDTTADTTTITSWKSAFSGAKQATGYIEDKKAFTEFKWLWRGGNSGVVATYAAVLFGSNRGCSCHGGLCRRRRCHPTFRGRRRTRSVVGIHSTATTALSPVATPQFVVCRLQYVSSRNRNGRMGLISCHSEG